MWSCEYTGLAPAKKAKPYFFKYIVVNCQICATNPLTCSASFSHFVMLISVRLFGRGQYDIILRKITKKKDGPWYIIDLSYMRMLQKYNMLIPILNN